MIVTAEYVKTITPLKLILGKELSLKVDNDVTLISDATIIRHLAKSAAPLNLCGSTILEQTKVQFTYSIPGHF